MQLRQTCDEIDRSELQAARAALDAQGYCLGPVLFDDDEVRALRSACLRAAEGHRDFHCMHSTRTQPYEPWTGHIFQIINCWWISNLVRRAIFSPRIGRWASALMGVEEVRLVHDQVLIKPPVKTDSQDGNIGWHQDAAHFDVFDTTNFLTAWISLQHSTADNGAMQVVSGSHHWGYLPATRTFREKDLRFQEEALGQKIAWTPEYVVLAPGQVSFHVGLALHGSGPNRTDEPRIGVAVNMMPGSTGYNRFGRYHFLGSLMGPFVRHGDIATDPLFPRVWPTDARLSGEPLLSGADQ